MPEFTRSDEFLRDGERAAVSHSVRIIGAELLLFVFAFA